ncbi:hypothetical protein PoB_000371200 [Plakobranchus ocellatus]|uniref:Secreted protein n=1 Tax=Plakobranchus ocellatus TaxID=259542 RepID=A0AAV3Y391_9GAST|nr:hypothetical protein PoB_000371200 [Plakobranchus ocellatus]
MLYIRRLAVQKLLYIRYSLECVGDGAGGAQLCRYAGAIEGFGVYRYRSKSPRIRLEARCNASVALLQTLTDRQRVRHIPHTHILHVTARHHPPSTQRPQNNKQVHIRRIVTTD